MIAMATTNTAVVIKHTVIAHMFAVELNCFHVTLPHLAVTRGQRTAVVTEQISKSRPSVTTITLTNAVLEKLSRKPQLPTSTVVERKHIHTRHKRVVLVKLRAGQTPEAIAVVKKFMTTPNSCAVIIRF